jgi:hypothetical protein
MRPELPAILRAYAADLAVCGAREVAIADLLREAADALLTAPVRVIQDQHGTFSQIHTPLIYDRCPACEEE